MKKIIALTLCFAMTLTMATSVMADKLEAEPGEDFVSEDKKELIDYRDIFDIEYPTDTLVPGQVYYFPATVDGEPMTEEFFDVFEVSLNVGTIYERGDKDYMSSTEARNYVRSVEYMKGTDDKYYVKFIAATGKKYDDDEVTIKIYSICKEKDNVDYRGWVEFEIDLGYDFNNSVVEVYEEKYEVDNDQPVTLFGRDLEDCEITFDDGSYYDARFNLSRDRELNLFYVELDHPAIIAANPDAKLTSLSFPATPAFSEEGRFHYYAPDAEFLYEIVDEDGSLKLIDTKNKGDYFAFQIEELGNYVASDIKLSSIFDVEVEKEEEKEKEEPSEPLESTTIISPPTTPPPVTTNPNPNPSTGAMA